MNKIRGASARIGAAPEPKQTAGTDAASAPPSASDLAADRELEWKAMVDAFLSSAASLVEIADTGYRLSRFYPAAKDDPRRAYASERMAAVDDKQIVRIIDGVELAIGDGRGDVGDHLCWMLTYVPDGATRIERLIQRGSVSRRSRGVASEVVDFLRRAKADGLPL